MIGDDTSGIRTLFTMPGTFSASVPAAMTVAPNSPPIRA